MNRNYKSQNTLPELYRKSFIFPLIKSGMIAALNITNNYTTLSRIVAIATPVTPINYWRNCTEGV